jgi:hypothetical protein
MDGNCLNNLAKKIKLSIEKMEGINLNESSISLNISQFLAYEEMRQDKITTSCKLVEKVFTEEAFSKGFFGKLIFRLNSSESMVTNSPKEKDFEEEIKFEIVKFLIRIYPNRLINCVAWPRSAMFKSF